jgi:hypothetical protein
MTAMIVIHVELLGGLCERGKAMMRATAATIAMIVAQAARAALVTWVELVLIGSRQTSEIRMILSSARNSIFAMQPLSYPNYYDTHMTRLLLRPSH